MQTSVPTVRAPKVQGQSVQAGRDGNSNLYTKVSVGKSGHSCIIQSVEQTSIRKSQFLKQIYHFGLR